MNPSILDQLTRRRLLVIGDLILDRYTWGAADRISPEAPVVVLQNLDHEVRPGGAASVAAMLRALQAEVTLAGVIGDDADGRILQKLLGDEGVDAGLVLIDAGRPTTSKERFLGKAANRSSRQLLRVDRESRLPLDAPLQKHLTAAIIGRLDDHDALLISDYGKGVCTPELLHAIIIEAARRSLPVIVDPPQLSDYCRYTGATLLTPNRSDAEFASQQTIHTPAEALAAGKTLLAQSQAQGILITLDQDGMALVHQDQPETHFPTRPRSVCDVSGAGDTVLAVVGLCCAAGVPLSDAIPLANIAAGLQVEQIGVAAISQKQLRQELTRLEKPTSCKLVTLEEMLALAQTYRRQGRTIVFTNGCFDLLHVGHVSYLQEASRLGDVLLVAINSDDSVRRLKGSNRPIINERDRALMLSGLECVTHVLIQQDDTPHRLLEQLRPDMLVKGGTYSADEVVGKEIVEAYGGKVLALHKIDGISTTSIVNMIQNPHAGRRLETGGRRENPPLAPCVH